MKQDPGARSVASRPPSHIITVRRLHTHEMEQAGDDEQREMERMKRAADSANVCTAQVSDTCMRPHGYLKVAIWHSIMTPQTQVPTALDAFHRLEEAFGRSRGGRLHGRRRSNSGDRNTSSSRAARLNSHPTPATALLMAPDSQAAYLLKRATETASLPRSEYVRLLILEHQWRLLRCSGSAPTSPCSEICGGLASSQQWTIRE